MKEAAGAEARSVKPTTATKARSRAAAEAKTKAAAEAKVSEAKKPKPKAKAKRSIENAWEAEAVEKIYLALLSSEAESKQQNEEVSEAEESKPLVGSAKAREQ